MITDLGAVATPKGVESGVSGSSIPYISSSLPMLACYQGSPFRLPVAIKMKYAKKKWDSRIPCLSTVWSAPSSKHRAFSGPGFLDSRRSISATIQSAYGIGARALPH